MESISIAEYQKLCGGRSKKKSNSKRSTRVKTHQSESIGESTLANQLRVLKISFEQEYKFHPKRKWRADFHIVGKMILVEVEGGVWSGGRHTRGKGYSADCEKYSAAAILGWVVIRGTTEQVKKGIVVGWIKEAIKKLKV